MTSLPVDEYAILLIIIIIYMFLGMFLERVAMLVLTLPLVLPIITVLSFGLSPEYAEMEMIWFGIIIVNVLETGMISPLVGMNAFTVKSIAPEVPMSTIFGRIGAFGFAVMAKPAFWLRSCKPRCFCLRRLLAGKETRYSVRLPEGRGRAGPGISEAAFQYTGGTDHAINALKTFAPAILLLLRTQCTRLAVDRCTPSCGHHRHCQRG